MENATVFVGILPSRNNFYGLLIKGYRIQVALVADSICIQAIGDKIGVFLIHCQCVVIPLIGQWHGVYECCRTTVRLPGIGNYLYHCNVSIGMELAGRRWIIAS